MQEENDEPTARRDLFEGYDFGPDDLDESCQEPKDDCEEWPNDPSDEWRREEQRQWLDHVVGDRSDYRRVLVLGDYCVALFDDDSVHLVKLDEWTALPHFNPAGKNDAELREKLKTYLCFL